MSNLMVQVFVPLEDSESNFIDPSTLINSMQSLALGNITIQYPSVSMFNQEIFQGQGSMLVWAMADTALSSAQTVYNNFFNSNAWAAGVVPHFLVVPLTAAG